MNREKEIFEELFVRYPALEGIREDIKSAYDVLCACDIAKPSPRSLKV